MFWRRKRLRELKRSMEWDRSGRRHWFIESHHVVKISDRFFVSHRGEVVARVGHLLDAFEEIRRRERRLKRQSARTAGTITGQWCICNGTIHVTKDAGCANADRPKRYYHKIRRADG